ncbi:uncharacterized protein B0I36DRAFT_436755 [Microdochium trichocladiopsis]|uniref:Uncharacterized protein n=1 Tax=Microdochium trichocladiopsis TaxID=1682393 RepID=A0A9P9BHN5_9PEZI|nr:uncharacterized protein B0I36DRAFT_436755 [Microdochium trichocladiopsis]KAH7012091.1 hypothetical protein B0I36DRAFT_436755 [Microdochium trichocladiopsis]
MDVNEWVNSIRATAGQKAFEQASPPTQRTKQQHLYTKRGQSLVSPPMSVASGASPSKRQRRTSTPPDVSDPLSDQDRLRGEQATPRPAHSMRLAPKSSASTVSSASVSSSRSSSPRKHLVALRTAHPAEGGAEVCGFNADDERMPAGLVEVFNTLQSPSPLLCSSTRDTIQAHYGATRNAQQWHEKSLYGMERSALGPTPDPCDIDDIVGEADNCARLMLDEEAWTTTVIYRLLRTALWPTPSGRLADNTNSRKDELADLRVIPCSSASIIPHYKTLRTPLKKVDLAVAYYPRDKHKKGELQKLLRASPLSEEEQSINFTSYPGLTEGPIVLSVEVKRAGDGAEAAKLQLLTWLSAQKNKVDELSLLTSSTSGIEKPDYLPAILVQGHDWNLVAFTMDAEGKRNHPATPKTGEYHTGSVLSVVSGTSPSSHLKGTADGQRYIEIDLNGTVERFIIIELISRSRSVVGRATTCWRARKEGEDDPSFVIKDSWQCCRRTEEGELLREANESGVINVPRYYHYYNVQVGHEADDVVNNVRRGLDTTTAMVHQPAHLGRAGGSSVSGSARTGRSGAAGSKRSSSQAGALPPPNKRPYSRSPTKPVSIARANRVHRRVITYGYGIPIYLAPSRSAFLGAMVDCIKAHESLWRKSKQLHRDISINNLLIRKDNHGVLHNGLLIDLDLGIRKQRGGPSGAVGMTGTRAFMAIGALLGEQYTFMHDLESFFWVLFWICIHFGENGEPRIHKWFEPWNYTDPKELATLKKGLVSDEDDFIKTVGKDFTKHYQVLIPYVNRLRMVVFPDGRRRKSRVRLRKEGGGQDGGEDEEDREEDLKLYSSMTEILRKAQEDPTIKDE